jgi:hypothetical protein
VPATSTRAVFDYVRRGTMLEHAQVGRLVEGGARSDDDEGEDDNDPDVDLLSGGGVLQAEYTPAYQDAGHSPISAALAFLRYHYTHH